MDRVVPASTLTEEQFSRIVAALRPLTDTAEAHAAPPAEPRLLRGFTQGALGLFGACVVIGVVANEPAPLAVLGFLSLLAGTWALINDLRQPAGRDRRHPERVVRGYYRGVGKGLWASAFSLLSPVGARLRVRVPEMGSWHDRILETVRSTPDQLAEFWRSITRPSGLRYRGLARVDVEPLDASGPVHRYRVTMKLVSVSRFTLPLLIVFFFGGVIVYLISRTEYEKRFDVVTYRAGDRWWVLCGELGSPAETLDGIDGIEEAVARAAGLRAV